MAIVPGDRKRERKRRGCLARSIVCAACTGPLAAKGVFLRNSTARSPWMRASWVHAADRPLTGGQAVAACRQTHTQRQASPDFFAAVANAASAGAFAACVQAGLFAITEPVVNRVNVERLSLLRAVGAVTPRMMLKHFQTTLPTSLIKAPLYEALVTLVMALSLPLSVQGLLIGFLFTTITMPITNFRARMSLQQDFRLADMYVAYAPTVVRDIVGGIARTWLTRFGVETLRLKPQTPKLMFCVMLLTCFASAPFNELRGYYLQSKGGARKPFHEFFKPINCIRSTVVGAVNFALALGAGYWIAPTVTHLIQHQFGKAYS
eukprot:TRINITY_DN93323_c0_g1_i1.p1 TRINITY_DN93323_c0_g1~~TRINITY_DN93323_c0_g1_i1.p1  ORF type:complete len:320 (+),score=41.93 TRINITY_DN93323_c0_g1_i1:65-1024(+)